MMDVNPSHEYNDAKEDQRRPAMFAGSWYTGGGKYLSLVLGDFLSKVPSRAIPLFPDRENGPWSGAQDLNFKLPHTVDSFGQEVIASPVQLPCERARIIIAPHAGYAYSGSTAAWAYASLDLKNIRRIFILGPSHHYGFSRCALTSYSKCETPMGDLTVDVNVNKRLYETQLFDWMTSEVDKAEHSIELQFPFLYKIISERCTEARKPKIVPILVGLTSLTSERRYGEVLAPFMADPETAFIISSDFCHWGVQFQYLYYEATHKDVGRELSIDDRGPFNPAIYQSIEQVDRRCMEAIESGSLDKFHKVLALTGNTVCGRHPIGVMMAALELLNQQHYENKDNGPLKNLKREKGTIGVRFIKYKQSSECYNVIDSSVSYCSALGVL